jgi:hypothetical protein
MNDKQKFFQMIKVDPSASEKEIQSAIKHFCKANHPDQNQGANQALFQEFNRLNAIYKQNQNLSSVTLPPVPSYRQYPQYPQSQPNPVGRRSEFNKRKQHLADQNAMVNQFIYASAALSGVFWMAVAPEPIKTIGAVLAVGFGYATLKEMFYPSRR